MSRSPFGSRILRRFLTLSAILVIGTLAQAEETNLLAILYKLQAANATGREFEDASLVLIKRFASEYDQGVIYAAVADAYATRQRTKYPEKIIHYADKALEKPIPPRDKCRMYIFVGETVQLQMHGMAAEKVTAARQEALIAYLKGLKHAFDIVGDKTARDPGGFPKEDLGLSAGTPEFERHEKDREARYKAHRKVFEDNDLIRFRDILHKKVLILYKQYQGATSEIREQAAKIDLPTQLVDRLCEEAEKAMKPEHIRK
jgi:hypothetical protein